MLKETLLPLEGGAVLALTVDGGSSHEPQSRSLELAYAFESLPDGTSRDVFELVTESLPGDRELSDKHASQAKGQDEVAKLYAGKKYATYLLENAARERTLAEQALIDSRRLPTNTWYLGGRRLLIEYQLDSLPRRYRVVSLESGKDFEQFDGEALYKAIKRQKLHGDANLVDPRKYRILAARGQQFLVDGGLVTAVLERQSDGFRCLGLYQCMHGGWPSSAATGLGFVCEIAPEHNQREILYFDLSSGCVPKRWPRKRHVTTSFAASSPPNSLIALTSIGGDVALLDVTSDAVAALPGFLGLGKDEALDVRISPDARYVVAFPWHGKRYGVFDTMTQSCVVLDLPPHEIVELKGMREVRASDVAATTSELVMLSRGQITRTPWNALAWQTPPAPIPKLKKGKTPLETIAAATASGPLKPIAGMVHSWYAASVALIPTKQRKDLAAGESKFNGLPDLAEGTAWPRWREVPMAFLAQIDCAAAKAIAPELGLPDSGLLSFFLALDPDYPLPSFYSDANSDHGGARVLYTPAAATLARLPLPKDTPSEYIETERPVCKLKMVRAGAVLPELTNPIVALAELTPTQAQAYQALADLVNGDDEDPKHLGSRLGGHPALMQGDTLQLTAESFERGDGSLSGKGWDEPEFQRASAAWGQLMQMASGDEEWLWGDGGLMHWMVRKSDFESARFSSVWTVGVN